MSYPTQEDEMRAKEAAAVSLEAAEESRFLSTFHTTPKNNPGRLQELSGRVANGFNATMEKARQQPYERQEDLMIGLKKLFEEERRVVEARLAYTMKINPSTANSAE
jgi:hypothetical protein